MTINRHIILWLGLLGCSHEANRDSPLDPDLSTPVQLTAVAGDNTGTVTLSWTAYDDPAAFSAYWVLRSELDLASVDTLADITDIAQTTFVDTSLDLERVYEYRLVTVNAGGLETSSIDVRIGSIALPSITLEPPIFDSATASALIRWSGYDGARFREYQLLRRSAGVATDTIAQISSRDDTTFADSGLAGNTEYIYRVDVVTQRDEVLEGSEQRGGIHALVGLWSLDTDEGGRVRLYAMGDTLLALVATEDGIQLHRFTGMGSLLSPAAQLAPIDRINPGSVSLARGPDGVLLVSAARFIGSFLGSSTGGGLLLSAVEGDTLVRRTVDLFTTETVAHTASSFSRFAFDGILLQPLPRSIAVFRGQTLIDVAAGAGTSFPRWDYERLGSTPPSFVLQRDTFPSPPDRLQSVLAVGSNQDRRTSLTVTGEFAEGGSMELIFRGNTATRTVRRTDGATAFMAEAAVIPRGFAARVDMSAIDLSVSVGFPDQWHEIVSSAPSFLSLVTAGESVFLFRDDSLRRFESADLLAGDATPEELSLAGSGIVSEMRQWSRRRSEGSGSSRLGLCFPHDHRVHIHNLRIPAGEATPSPVRELSIGQQPGAAAGQFVVPLSLDVGPDERIYVLDAGNGRIQVFDFDGTYITQFGGFGGGEGEFDFLGGAEATDFAGSIAVDDDGFIYVADVGNQRIQKFAP